MDTKVIVVVASQPATAQAVQSVLNSVPGYGSVTVGHGEAAPRVIAEVNADLAILDVELPGISGLGVRERLRGRIGTAAVPILFLATPADEALLTRCHIQDYVRKPVDPDELLRRVRELLTREPASN